MRSMYNTMYYAHIAHIYNPYDNNNKLENGEILSNFVFACVSGLYILSFFVSRCISLIFVLTLAFPAMILSKGKNFGVLSMF